MPLTPADVHNVAFSKPPIGKRGYNEDEVDAFLDLVENELTRLIEENSDLRQRIEELDREHLMTSLPEEDESIINDYMRRQFAGADASAVGNGGMH